MVIGVPAGLLGLFKAIYEIGENRRQRADELRWRKMNAAKDLLDGIHEHEFAKNAVHMLDWSGGQAQYETLPGHKELISYSEVLAALARNEAPPQAQKDIYIRDCFDWFFYRLDRIEHYITRGLIDFEDVRAVFKVYAREIAKHRSEYDAFLEFHEYDLARQFFHRF